MRPMKFEPILKRLIWGGRKLETVLNKTLGEGEDFAESWEVADHRDDVSRVAEGPLAGETLRGLVRDRAGDLLGPSRSGCVQFPLLVKFIDARQSLSVQVHPDDATGGRLSGDNGKTEAWVVLHAEPGSVIYAGLRPGTTPSAFAEAMETGGVEALLHRLPARAGDCIFIPAGTVHAIGAGVVLAEVQQMSDATYRIFDWGRTGPDGRPRPLHREQAMESIDFDSGPISPVAGGPEAIAGGTLRRLVRCPHFALDRLRLDGPAVVGSPDRFTLLVGLGGTAEVRSGPTTQRLGRGETMLLPAIAGRCEVAPRAGGVEFLHVRQSASRPEHAPIARARREERDRAGRVGGPADGFASLPDGVPGR